MKVCHVVYDLAPGGYQRLLLDLLPCLMDSGVDAQVVCLTASADLADSFAARGIPVHRLDKSNGSPLGFLRSLRRTLGELRPDVVQTHGFSAGLWGKVCSLGLAARRIETVHEEAGWMKPVRRKWIHRACLPVTGRMVAVSQVVKTSLVEREGIPEDRIVVIPNGIDPGRCRRTRSREEARRALALNPEAPVLGMIGRCRFEKGGDLWLRALAEVKRRGRTFSGVLVGDGPDRDSWEALSGELGLSDRVRFAGSVPDARPWMEALDLLVVPSRQESSGLVVLEAFAVGCPVIAAAVGGLPEWITHDRTGLLVPSEDIGSLADAICDALDHPAAAGDRAERASELFLERGRIAHTASRTLELYRLVHEKSASTARAVDATPPSP